MATTITVVATLISFVILIPISAIDITAILSHHPDLSDFSNLLSSTSIPADLSSRSSITLLALPNSLLRSPSITLPPDPSSLSDLLRYHVLLELLSWPQIRDVSPSGKLVTTLFQTTGRAANDFGSVNITRDPSSNAVSAQTPSSSYSPSNATILALIQSIPYNLTIVSLDSVLFPTGVGGPPTHTGGSTLGLNITDTLIQAHDFNVAASMLAASGIADEFEQDEQGAGISLFIPTDSAFATLSQSSRFQNLPADQKAMVLRFHALHSYYPLGSLQSIVNPVQPTLATELSGAGRFTLNISKINGSVAISTGIVQAIVSRTVFDQNPVAIFGVSKVLLPKEFFGKDSIISNESQSLPGDIPESSSRLSSPPGSELGSNGAEMTMGNTRSSLVLVMLFCCIGLYYGGTI
uniref:FAS1 domain-containing protein n=1 Tax=Kalanchoe fedtschenkoi TaxID=63787 RepID=A0A7N0TC63_KALFE